MAVQSRRNPSRHSLLPWWLVSFLFCTVFTVYTLTLNPSLFRNDSPETITACVTLGVCHPPGYPLHTLLGRLFSLVEPGNPAMALNFFSAILGAIGTCLLAANLFILSGRFTPMKGHRNPAPLMVACMVGAQSFAFSKSYWSAALAAKGGIYVFQAALELGTLLYFQLEAQKIKNSGAAISSGSFYFFVFLFSLGFANQWPTQMLLIPVISLGIFIYSRHKRFNLIKKISWKWIWNGLTIAMIVLSLYLYLPLRAHLYPALNFGAPFTLRRLAVSLLRTSYFKRETLASFIPTAFSTVQEKASYISNRFGNEYSVLFSLLALLGGYWLWKRGLKNELLFLLVLLLTTLGANLLYLQVSPIEFWHMDDHLMTVNWVMAILGCMGVYRLGTMASEHGTVKYALSFLLVLPFFTLQKNLALNDQSREFLFHGYGMEALQSMRRNARYFAESDFDYFSILYLKEAEHKRPDVDLTLTTFMTKSAWEGLVCRFSSTPPVGSQPVYCAFPNGDFVNRYLFFAKTAFFRPQGTITEFMPLKSSDNRKSLQPLEGLWERYLAPGRRSINPIDGFLLELCAHPYLNTADFLRLRGDLTCWDPLYEKGLSLISENPWLAETWARRAEGDAALGEKEKPRRTMRWRHSNTRAQAFQIRLG